MESNEANNPPYEPIETLKDSAISGHEVANAILDRVNRYPVESSSVCSDYDERGAGYRLSSLC